MAHRFDVKCKRTYSLPVHFPSTLAAWACLANHIRPMDTLNAQPTTFSSRVRIDWPQIDLIKIAHRSPATDICCMRANYSHLVTCSPKLLQEIAMFAYLDTRLYAWTCLGSYCTTCGADTTLWFNRTDNRCFDNRLPNTRRIKCVIESDAHIQILTWLYWIRLGIVVLWIFNKPLVFAYE